MRPYVPIHRFAVKNNFLFRLLVIRLVFVVISACLQRLCLNIVQVIAFILLLQLIHLVLCGSFSFAGNRGLRLFWFVNINDLYQCRNRASVKDWPILWYAVATPAAITLLTIAVIFLFDFQVLTILLGNSRACVWARATRALFLWLSALNRHFAFWSVSELLTLCFYSWTLCFYSWTLDTRVLGFRSL